MGTSAEKIRGKDFSFMLHMTTICVTRVSTSPGLSWFIELIVDNTPILWGELNPN